MAKATRTPAGKRPTAITTLKDSPSAGKRNWLIYSDSGVGKTSLAGTCPNGMFIVFEAAGTESAKALGSTADEFVIDNLDDYQEAYEYFRYGSGCSDYEWVMFDSVSEYEEMEWEALLRKANRTNLQAAIQDYGIIGGKVKRNVDQWNRLPVNVLYTAQTMRIDIETEDGDDETTLLLPLLGTKNGVVSQKVCGKTTLNGLLVPRKGDDADDPTTRRLWLEGTHRFVAKDRHDTFARYVDEPNIAEMATAVDARQDGGDKLSAAKKKKKGKAKS